MTSFKALRPPECIPVDAKGTYNVCVCKMHGNIRLKFKGIKEAIVRKNSEFKSTYHDYLQNMICSKQSADCYLGLCVKCPGTDKILSNLKFTLQRLKIDKISYDQWVSTDR